MEPLYFKVPRLDEESVRVEVLDLPHFFDPLHFHEDCQITLILEGEGSIIANNSIDTFYKGEILAFGRNFPHALRNDKRYYANNSKLHARAISIFFNEKLFMQVFELIPEFKKLKELMIALNFGIKLSSKPALKIARLIQELEPKKGVSRILSFIDILNQLSAVKSIKLLSKTMSDVCKLNGNIKLNKVYHYLLENYMNPIKLDDVASLINMTPNAFCRFFKNRTNKTFSGLLVEVRINEACKLLTDGNYNVTETYLSCGYNNSSNFHRQFRAQTGLTPIEYKKRF